MKSKKNLIIGIAAIVLVAVTTVAVLFATHVICIHKWQNATCQNPSTCSTCGKTEGTALGHQWIDATCVEARHCDRCGETEGEALGHELGAFNVTRVETCSLAGEKKATCSRCNEEFVEEIEKKPHTPGEWEVLKEYKILSDGTVEPGKEAVTCTVCSEEIESRELTIELTTSQKNAIIKAYDSIPFWHPSHDFLVYTLLVDFEGYEIEDAKFAADNIDVDWDEQAILYAKANASGKSRTGLRNSMRYQQFSDEQIEAALKEVGY